MSAIGRADLQTAAVERDCEVRFDRRSGPGGQNRNKVETAVVLRHLPTGLIAEANERRSQAQNRALALTRLKRILALKLRAAVDREGEPSDLWRSRCNGGRIAISTEHDDFPLILAEALDALEGAGAGIDPAPAAAWLGCTPSQLIKLLAKEPKALKQLNDRRRAAGLRALK